MATNYPLFMIDLKTWEDGGAMGTKISTWKFVKQNSLTSVPDGPCGASSSKSCCRDKGDN